MALNTDVILLIVEHLDLDDLLRLASTCRVFNYIVHHFAWSIFLRNNQRHSLTLHSSRSRWSHLAQVRYNTLVDRAWLSGSFIARPLSPPWRGNLQPTIALSASMLLVAAGSVIYSYAVHDTFDASPSRIVFECSYTIAPSRATAQPDITSVAFHPFQDRTVFLGFGDGFVEQVFLPPYQESHDGQHVSITRVPQHAVQYHDTDIVESISCPSHILLSLSQRGSVSLTNLASDSISSRTVNLDVRSWTSHLCMSSSSPYAVFGTTSATPLSVYNITPDGFSPIPSITLQSPKNSPSAVYGITCSPPSSPLGPSEQIIVSGWYDGSVRIYDLRVSCSQHPPDPSPASTSTLSSPVLLPVITLKDPWSFDPVYAVSCGGGNSSFVTAGMARHSVVTFWDVRKPFQGWNVYSPGNDQSPVYSLVLESSRLFGVTQSRPFVYDFGPGVTKDTYPPITTAPPNATAGRRRTAGGRLRLERNGVGYHVSKYHHRWTAIHSAD